MKKIHLYVLIMLLAFAAGKLRGNVSPVQESIGPVKQERGIASGKQGVFIHARKTARPLFAESKIQNSYPCFRQYSAKNYISASQCSFLPSLTKPGRKITYEIVFPGIHQLPIYLVCCKMVI